MIAYTNLKIVTVDQAFTIYESGYVVIDNETIHSLGDMASFNPQNYVTIHDYHGFIVAPGFINAHTHLGLIPLRSLADDMPDRLRNYLFPMEQKFMNKDNVVSASAYAALESLLNGTTTVADMYYYSDAVAHILDTLGVRALVGQTIIEDSQIDFMTEAHALLETEKFIQKWSKHDRIQPMIAPHGTTTVSESALKAIGVLSKKTDTKVMMHVAEMDYEMTHFAPSTPIAYLATLGLLDQNFLAVHSIHTTPDDLITLAKHNVSVVHCPGANMKAGKGIADVKGMHAHGICVALGTDGPVSGNTLDMMGVMRLSAIAQKTRYRERDLNPSSLTLKMATIDAAKALGIDHLVGSIEVGKKADLVFIETQSANMYPLYDLDAVLVYQTQSQNIHSVMVNGVFKVINHHLVGHDLNTYRTQLEPMIYAINQNNHNSKK